MSEWLTYSLYDILPFAPETYYRLFELYNRAVFPAQLVALLLGLAVPALLWRPPRWQGRAIAAFLATAWLWVAWAFHLERYASLNWAAEYFAWGFAAQALLLLWFGAVRGRLQFRMRGNAVTYGALGLYLFALLAQPLIGVLTVRSWPEVELFGIGPDPTAVATLGLLLLTVGRTQWALLALPLLWCAIAGATAHAMEAPDAALMPAAGLLALLLAAWRSASRR